MSSSFFSILVVMPNISRRATPRMDGSDHDDAAEAARFTADLGGRSAHLGGDEV